MPFYFFIVGHTIDVFSTAEYKVLEHYTVNSYLGGNQLYVEPAKRAG